MDSESPMSIEIEQQRGLFDQYLHSKQQGTRDVKETSKLLLELVKTLSSNVPEISGELQKYAAALSGDKTVDFSYLQVIAVMSSSSVKEFIILLLQLQNMTTSSQLEICCSLLLTMTQVFPEIIHEEERFRILLLKISDLVLDAVKMDVNSQLYKELFATELYPLLLSSEKRIINFSSYLSQHLPDCINFYLACVLKPSTTDSMNMFPEEAWTSLEQIMKEMAKIKNLNLPCFWDSFRPDIGELTIWWNTFQKVTNDTDEVYLLSCVIFWSFLITWYQSVKDMCDVPERRPFLISAPTSSIAKPNSLEFRLTKIFVLARETYNYFHLIADQKSRNFIVSFVEKLKLDHSACFLTFQGDLSIVTNDNILAKNVSSFFPEWIKMQLRIQRICFDVRSMTLLSMDVMDEIVMAARNLRLHDSRFSKSRGRTLLPYMSTDFEILEYLCTVLLTHIKSIPLMRASDDFLSMALVILQPILSSQMDFFTSLMTTIASRPKFVFHKFFSYIMCLEIIAEFSVISSDVALELTSQPLIGTTPNATVHKTRGANRGSMEALQMELQRHAMTASSLLNCHGVVRTFLHEEKDLVSWVLFSGPGSSQPRRAKAVF